MRGRRYFSIVGNLTHVPKPLDRGSAVGERAHFLVARCMLEYQNILGDGGSGEARMRRQHREGSRERTERGEIELRVAPLQDFDRLETVALQRMYKLGVERRAAPGGAEGAVARGATGAAGDLGEFSRTETTKLVTVELAVGRKRHMIDIEVESHPDRVGGDEIIDIA